jgi:hypothetical protein
MSIKLTANTSLLTLLKNHMSLHISEPGQSPYIRSSTTGKRCIRAYRPKYHQQKNFDFTLDGLTQALQWAATGWISFEDTTGASNDVPKW